MLHGDQLRVAVFVLFASLAAAGLVVTRPSQTLIGCLALAGLLAAAGMRSRIPRLQRVVVTNEEELRDDDDGAYSTPRALMYAGLLTSCWLRLRVHGVTLSDGLFLLAFACAAAEALVLRDTRRAINDVLWIGIGLFVVGGAISTVARSHDPYSSFAIIARVFYLVAGWFWTGAKTFRTREHLWTALRLWVTSAALCGFWTVGQKYFGLPGAIDAGRFAGLADHVNDLGALASCAIVPALVLTWKDRRWGVAALGIAVGLLLSESIGGGIAALVALSFGLLAPTLTRPTLIALAVGAVGFVLATPLVGQTAVTRFATATSASAPFNQDTFNIRTRVYVLAWRELKQHPLVGTGLDTTSSTLFEQRTERFYEVHNLFLASWFEGGILALGGILVLEVGLLALAWRQVKAGYDRLLALTLLAGFLAYLIAELSEPALYKRYSLVPALLVVALAYQNERLPAVSPSVLPDLPQPVTGVGAAG